MRLGKLKAYSYVWDLGKPTAIPGIALRAGDRVLSHLSWEDAEALAERIFDLIDERDAAA